MTITLITLLAACLLCWLWCYLWFCQELKESDAAFDNCHQNCNKLRAINHDLAEQNTALHRRIGQANETVETLTAQHEKSVQDYLRQRQETNDARRELEMERNNRQVLIAQLEELARNNR